MRMIRRLSLTVLLLSLLAACGAAEVSTTVSQTVNEISKTSVDALGSQLPSIEQAIDAGKTEEARTAFNAFLVGWDAIKEQAKMAAPQAAADIQTTMDSIKKTLIDTPTPNAAEVKASLATLETQFNALSGSIK